METNLLVAISNLVKNPITNLASHYSGSNRINNMGDALEVYIKDLFCGSLDEIDKNKKNQIYSKHFSYIGNKNHPPDIIIRESDAIEVKKIENLSNGIQLNSSYPKSKLFSDNRMLTNDCRECEKDGWEEKDLLYVIGSAKNEKLNAIWFVYGDCYAARKDIYEKIDNTISAGINNLQTVEFSKTKELGKVKKVDPLGITNLRIRGMWGIEHPIKVFDYVVSTKKESKFYAHAILLKEKYLSFPEENRNHLESLVSDSFSINDIMIKSPNNPAILLDSKLLSFEV